MCKRLNLTAERVRHGMKQRDLAEALDVSVSTVQRWERGETAPGGPSLIALSELFGCDAGYLLEDDGKGV